MPFRLDSERYGEFRAKIAFTTSARMPSDIYEACKATGVVSNTVYVQHAVCEALARDLGIPVEELKAALPTPRGPAAAVLAPGWRAPIHLEHSGGVFRVGPANTDEEVR